MPSPGGVSFVALQFDDSTTHRPFVAPFAGVEWQATDHLSFSVLARLEVPVTAVSSTVLVIPLTVGWSWFLM